MLQPNDLAPAFAATDQHGHLHRFPEDYAGRTVVLYFYPKDDTPGCTAQACDLRDNHARFTAAGYAILGVSTDNEASHARFAQKFDLPFPLLADPEKQLVEAYGVWQEKKNYGRTYWGTVRTTFIIGPDGKIERVIKKPDTKAHAAQVLGAV